MCKKYILHSKKVAILFGRLIYIRRPVSSDLHYRLERDYTEILKDDGIVFIHGQTGSQLATSDDASHLN